MLHKIVNIGFKKIILSNYIFTQLETRQFLSSKIDNVTSILNQSKNNIPPGGLQYDINFYIL